MLTRRKLLIGASSIPLISMTNNSVDAGIRELIRSPKRFYFDANNGFSNQYIDKVVATYGENILIGVDPGMGDRPDDNAMRQVVHILNKNALLHVYLVGPGMLSWSAGEAQQIKEHAQSVGINTDKNNWHSEWKKHGWLKKAKEQFTYYYSLGAYSCEIDNLDGIYDQSPIETVKFFEHFYDWQQDAGINVKLMIKNLDSDQLKAIMKCKVPYNFYAEWGMFEAGSGSPDEQIYLCKKMGIYAVTPKSGITPTRQYGVKGGGVGMGLYSSDKQITPRRSGIISGGISRW